MTIGTPQLSVALWANACGLTSDDLPLQLVVHASELIEGYEGILNNDPQEAMDGLVDVDWMCQMVEHLTDGVLNLRPHFEELKQAVTNKYPTLVEQHFEPFKQAVLESNFSKLCQTQEEVDQSYAMFASKGMEVYMVETDGVYCMRSKVDQQDANGVHYPKDKVLKAVNYFKPDYVVEI